MMQALPPVVCVCMRHIAGQEVEDIRALGPVLAAVGEGGDPLAGWMDVVTSVKAWVQGTTYPPSERALHSLKPARARGPGASSAGAHCIWGALSQYAGHTASTSNHSVLAVPQ